MTTYSSAIQYFEANGVKYRVREEGKSVILRFVGFSNKESVETTIFFDEGDVGIAIRSWELCRVPESKEAIALNTCNELNKKYRWVKFNYDQKALCVNLAIDNMVTESTVGEFVYRLANKMASIGDVAYAELMNALWA